jgi:hypothetical protein
MTWSRIARRIRVPLGFAFAALYIWRARPTWLSLAIGGVAALIGVAIRAVASGHISKNSELTTSGPYAYTRNPLYLGSIVIALGFAVAALSPLIVVALVLPLVACSSSEKIATTNTGQQTASNLLSDPIKLDSGYVAGTVVGDPGKEVHVYRSIPYAAPPVAAEPVASATPTSPIFLCGVTGG